MKLETDIELREVLYDLYISLFKARKRCPDDFKDGRITTILTAVMGLENIGWRVIGITEEALNTFAENDFKRVPRKFCRGHRIDRVSTARELLDGNKAKSINDFFDIFLRNDCTVIMLNEQNKHSESFPNFIKIDNPDGELFSNNALIGWKHRKKEREFLEELYASRLNKR